MQAASGRAAQLRRSVRSISLAPLEVARVHDAAILSMGAQIERAQGRGSPGLECRPPATDEANTPQSNEDEVGSATLQRHRGALVAGLPLCSQAGG